MRYLLFSQDLMLRLLTAVKAEEPGGERDLRRMALEHSMHRMAVIEIQDVDNVITDREIIDR